MGFFDNLFGKKNSGNKIKIKFIKMLSNVFVVSVEKRFIVTT